MAITLVTSCGSTPTEVKTTDSVPTMGEDREVAPKRNGQLLVEVAEEEGEQSIAREPCSSDSKPETDSDYDLKGKTCSFACCSPEYLADTRRRGVKTLCCYCDGF